MTHAQELRALAENFYVDRATVKLALRRIADELEALKAREPMTDEQIEPLFRARKNQQTVGEKDEWYWYAWGVSDGEAHHKIPSKE